MKNVIIFGGNGYIGRAIATKLALNGYHITVVGRSTKANVVCHKYIQLDLAKPNSFRLINLDEVDIVIDLVSYILPNSKNISVSDIKIALRGYENLLRHFSEKNYYFFSSGGTVYGNSDSSNLEGAALKPLCPYGTQKVLQEDFVNKIIERGAIFRVSNPYGSTQKVKNGVGFISYLLECYRTRKAVNLVVPKQTMRDYIDIFDLSEIVYRTISHGHLELDTFNVSTGIGNTLSSLVESLDDSFEIKIKMDLKQYNSKTHIIQNVLNNEKITKFTGFDVENKVKSFILENSKLINSELIEL